MRRRGCPQARSGCTSTHDADSATFCSRRSRRRVRTRATPAGTAASSAPAGGSRAGRSPSASGAMPGRRRHERRTHRASRHRRRRARDGARGRRLPDARLPAGGRRRPRAERRRSRRVDRDRAALRRARLPVEGGGAAMSSRPYQLFKDLPPAVESALRGSIDRFGVLVPVAKDQHGNVLDGHQRARLADEIGIKYPVNIIEVADDYEAREIARTLNEDRRAMPKEERLPVVQALREDGHSLRAIAVAVVVSHEQVRKDLAPVNDLTPDQTRGLDGKSYPARKQPVVPATFAARERQQAREEVLARETESSPRRPL